MKKSIFLTLAFFLGCFPLFGAQQWPSPTGNFNDFAHVVPADQAQALESLLSSIREKTGIQMAVVTLPSVEGADIDGAAVDLFKAWGIGQKGKDNGLLVLLSVNDRKDRIEVGYGLEATITDGDTGTIRRRIMEPAFKQGNYGQGLTNGVLQLAQLVGYDGGADAADQPQANSGQGQGGLGFWGTIILFIVIFLLLSSLNRRGRGGFWGGGFYGGGWGGGGFGGGGGGFGGFGGGGSGGGGSSGGW